MFVLADTHVFNSDLINVARFGFMRFDGLSAVANPILATDLVSAPRRESRTDIRGARVSISGLFTTGDAARHRSGKTQTASSGRTQFPHPQSA